MSGWKLSGPVKYTFPAGSVIDQAFDETPGEVFVVTDRKTYVANLATTTELTDQVIIGNAAVGEGVVFALEDANGVEVIAAETPGGDDWPSDPDTEITDTMTAEDLGITAGSFTDAMPVELRKFAKWAKAEEIAFSGSEKNSLSFDENGNPLNDVTKAYLLNCATSELTTKEPEFKFTSITPGVQPTIEGTFNGTVNYQGRTSLSTGEWSAADASSHHFFRATLTR